MKGEVIDKAFIEFRDEELGGINGSWDGEDRIRFNKAFLVSDAVTRWNRRTEAQK